MAKIASASQTIMSGTPPRYKYVVTTLQVFARKKEFELSLPHMTTPLNGG